VLGYGNHKPQQKVCKSSRERRLCRQLFLFFISKSQLTGNLVSDAWFAALAIESGCEWITTDGDYARFKGLNWRPPF
jgi:predicted nucleic acid-binding protein